MTYSIKNKYIDIKYMINYFYINHLSWNTSLAETGLNHSLHPFEETKYGSLLAKRIGIYI